MEAAESGFNHDRRQDLLGRLGERPEILFSPHSGPFARGMHATLFLRAHDEWSTDEANDHLRQFFATMPFVDVTSAPPAVKDVVCSNRCLVHAAANGHDVVVHSVIDNLTKGAAGGGVQWMNRLLGLDETAGLLAPAPGWS